MVEAATYIIRRRPRIKTILWFRNLNENKTKFSGMVIYWLEDLYQLWEEDQLGAWFGAYRSRHNVLNAIL